MNKARLLPILLLTPFLMANSPCPCPTEEKYESIDVSYANVGNEYTFTVTNSGDKYASLMDINSDRYVGIREYYHPEIFYNEYIIPQKTRVFTVTLNNEPTFKPSTKFYTYTLAYLDSGVKISGLSIEQKGDTSYQVKGTFSDVGDYYYSLMLEFNYDGSDYAIEVNYPDLKFSTAQHIDLNKLVIKKASMYRSSYNTYKNNFWNIVTTALIVGGVIGGLFLLSFIAACIVVPILVSRHIRKKHKAITK